MRRRFLSLKLRRDLLKVDSYKVELTKSSEKDLRRIDRRYLSGIWASVESLEDVGRA